MAYRLASIRGFEVLLNLDDRARSSGLWQYVLKPAVHKLTSAKTVVGAAAASLAARREHTAAAIAATPITSITPEQQRILDKIKGIEWYHTIDVGHGIKTPGRFDHYPLLQDYRLPASLKGQRAIDVATNNGFWAFQMEQRGAQEVVAIDVDCHGDLDLPPRQRAGSTPEELKQPRGTGFFVAQELLKSKVQRRPINVYDLSPSNVGQFDFVFVGDLLLHLLNPVKAAAAISSITSGVAHVVECYSPFLPPMTMHYQGADQATWWGVSLGALEKILYDGGFNKVELIHKFKAPSQPGQPAWMWRAVFRCTH